MPLQPPKSPTKDPAGFVPPPGTGIMPGIAALTTASGKPVQVSWLGGLDVREMMGAVSEAEFRAYYIHWVELSLRHQAACRNARQVEI